MLYKKTLQELQKLPYTSLLESQVQMSVLSVLSVQMTMMSMMTMTTTIMMVMMTMAKVGIVLSVLYDLSVVLPSCSCQMSPHMTFLKRINGRI